MNNNNNIFISVAAYRDPELIPTIKDCIAKAKYPEKLSFGICWQKDETENLDEVLSQATIRLHTCDWKESKGACWARHTIQKHLYHNEQYYLQLDSHHRFLQDWDEHLRYLYFSSGSKKPIIGTYGTTYWPETDKDDSSLKNEPYRIISFDSFGEDGDLISRPQFIRDHLKLREEKKDLIPARLLSGHFIFTDGHFCRECLYDPNLYFRGEELTLSARAYTHGYDMFHPTYTIIWHEYLRKEQHKHWEDHVPSNGFIIEAEQRNVRSKERQRQLLGIDPSTIDFRHYGLGKVRSLHEYELYSGIDFKNKRVHQSCASISTEAPDPYVMTEEEWSAGMLQNHNIVVTWDLTKIPDNKEFDFWFFGFEDSDSKLLWRKDFTTEDVYYDNIFHKKQNSHRSVFGCSGTPYQCVLIPHSKDTGWAEKVIVKL